jgi:prephenate dehydratase
MTAKISYQGEPGANSHIACLEACPSYEPLPCRTFEDAFQAVEDGTAALAMIPTDNSVAGRVADIHHLLPHSALSIIGEHFLPVHHQLLVVKGTKLSDLTSVHSHVHALGQCRKVIREMGLNAVVAVDTAGAARELSEIKDKSRAAIATRLAGDIYGLEVIRADIEDEAHNTTRFVILSKQRADAEPGAGASDDQLCLPCTERSRRPLQSHGRLCHQWRQHDQAGVIPVGGTLLGHAVLCRNRGPSRRPFGAPRTGRAGLLHQLHAGSWRLSGKPVSR